MRDSCQHAGLRSSPSLAVFTIDQIASDLGGYDASTKGPLRLLVVPFRFERKLRILEIPVLTITP